MIVSGVLLGALLAFITLRLGWLRHYIRLNDRLVNAIFPLGPQVFFFTLPLWFIVTLPSAVHFSSMYLTVVWVVTGLTLLVIAAEYATALYQSWIPYASSAPEYNVILESTIKIPAQMTETPT